MLTQIETLEIMDGLAELTLKGGEFTDGDYRPRISIRLPKNINKHDSVRDVERMILAWDQKEISAQLND